MRASIYYEIINVEVSVALFEETLQRVDAALGEPSFPTGVHRIDQHGNLLLQQQDGSVLWRFLPQQPGMHFPMFRIATEPLALC